MKVIYLTLTLVVVLLVIVIYLVFNNKSVPPTISLNNSADEQSNCITGFKSYQNTASGFSMCIPDDAEVITQFESEDGEILDLVVVRRNDLPKLHEYKGFYDNPYLAIVKSKVSAFAIERVSRGEVVDENVLKSVIPTQIPCADKSLGCTDGEMLNVRVLEWEKVPAKNLTFRYRDEVLSGTKKKWTDVGFMWTDGKTTYQMESIVPSNPINEQALMAMAESFR